MRVAESEPYVEVAKVSKVYRSGGADAVEAVSSVSFGVLRGQFVAILGPSGCGKSTLLMMVGGLEPVTAGTISIGGSPMTGPRTNVGVMFQDPTLLPWKSAIDNVLFPLRVLKRPLDARACQGDDEGARHRSRNRPRVRVDGVGSEYCRRPVRFRHRRGAVADFVDSEEPPAGRARHLRL
jgi:ABC-type sugar transport system ATPase subunit